MPGLPWIQVAVGMPDHPKVRALALELGVDRVQAVGHLIVLWTSIGRLAPAGGLSTPNADAVLEQLAGWSGEKGRFAAAALACGLLDRTEDGLYVHDWKDHAGAFVEKFRRDAARQKARRQSSKRPSDVQRSSIGRPSDVLRETEREREREKKKLPQKGSGEAEGLWELFAATRASLSVLGPDGFTDMATPRPVEARPESWPAWAASALSEVGVDAVPRLLCAYKAFLRDKTFAAKTPPWATQVFMHPNVWRGRVPEARAA